LTACHGKLPTLAEMPWMSAPVRSTCCGHFATGSYDPVLRMVLILEWARTAQTDWLTVSKCQAHLH
jgi:hypothetical protein